MKPINTEYVRAALSVAFPGVAVDRDPTSDSYLISIEGKPAVQVTGYTIRRAPDRVIEIVREAVKR